MGLIYVNPEGPNGNPDPVASGRDVRETFARMAMDDEETVALVAGGHTFGKAHGAGDPSLVGPEPEGAGTEEQGLGWRNSFGTGKGVHTTTSGIEGAWKPNPTQWDNGYFDMLFGYEWQLTKSPAGAHQWTPINCKPEHMIPDAHDPSKRFPHDDHGGSLPCGLTRPTKNCRRFHQNPAEFADAFARAWFKLTHRDLGPRSRYLGKLVPAQTLLWQDPIPAVDHPLVNEQDIQTLKARLLASGLSIASLVNTAWASAASFRGSDKRGGANGARIRLSPQNSWAVNNPQQLMPVLDQLAAIQDEFNRAQTNAKRISLADLIVLGGNAAIEAAAGQAGVRIEVPFAPGRMDASQAQTDVESFQVLEPKADGFRNYVAPGLEDVAAQLLIDKAQLLNLSAPEMTVLVGGLRVLNANTGNNPQGVFTQRPQTLSNDFFVHLLDMNTQWSKVPGAHHLEGKTAARVQ